MIVAIRFLCPNLKRLRSVHARPQALGISEKTIEQAASQDHIKPSTMIKAIAAAVELTGDVDRAIYWFRNEPIADYRHKTTAELVAEGHLDAVLTYLDDLKNGASG